MNMTWPTMENQKLKSFANPLLSLLIQALEPSNIQLQNPIKQVEISKQYMCIQPYNWSKITVKEDNSKNYQYNNIYGKSLYQCNKGKYI